MIRRAFAAWLALAVAALVAPAQVRTRSVEGKVTDRQGNALKGAVVKIKDTRTLRIRSFITPESGAYQFQGLNPDVDYELKADYQGSSSSVKTLSAFNSREKAVIDLRVDVK